MKKFLSFISAIALCIVFVAPVVVVNAASTSRPIAPVIITKPDDIGWEGYTVSPTLKFYVDESAANSSGTLFDPDGNHIFNNFSIALDYRAREYTGQAVEIYLRSDITNVVNFSARLVDVLVEGNGYSFKRVSGSLLRAFETSRQVRNTEFRNVTFDGGDFVYGGGLIFEGVVQHKNIKFTNVNIKINVEAKPLDTGLSTTPRVLSFFDASNVTFENVSLSGSMLMNATDYQWPIQIYSNCHDFDMSGITDVPINSSGKPVAIGFWNNLYDAYAEPYNIYVPNYPYLLTYTSATVHRTLAFSNLDDAKNFAAENPDLYTKYYYAGEPMLECIIDLTTHTFFINSGATLERAVNFINYTDHGPDHSTVITDPADVTMDVGEQKNSGFKITDAANASYVFDFSEAVKDSDYILESSDENVVASADISIGSNDNTIYFKAAGAGKTIISLKTMAGTIITSFEVTVYDVTPPTEPPTDPPTVPSTDTPKTGDVHTNIFLIFFVLSTLILVMLFVLKKSKYLQ